MPNTMLSLLIELNNKLFGSQQSDALTVIQQEFGNINLMWNC